MRDLPLAAVPRKLDGGFARARALAAADPQSGGRRLALRLLGASAARNGVCAPSATIRRVTSPPMSCGRHQWKVTREQIWCGRSVTARPQWPCAPNSGWQQARPGGIWLQWAEPRLQSAAVHRQAGCRLLRRDRRLAGERRRGWAHVAAGDVKGGQRRVRILRQATSATLDQAGLRQTVCAE